MPISDEARYRLHQRLDELLGAQEAAALMSQLPPMGWGDLATKRDLADLGSSLRSEMGALEARMGSEMATLRSQMGFEMGALEARMGGRLDRELRLMTWRLITAMVAVMSVFVAAVRL